MDVWNQPSPRQGDTARTRNRKNLTLNPASSGNLRTSVYLTLSESVLIQLNGTMKLILIPKSFIIKALRFNKLFHSSQIGFKSAIYYPIVSEFEWPDPSHFLEKVKQTVAQVHIPFFYVNVNIPVQTCNSREHDSRMGPFKPCKSIVIASKVEFLCLSNF